MSNNHSPATATKPARAPKAAKPKAVKKDKAAAVKPKAPRMTKPKVEGAKSTHALREAAKGYVHDKEHKTAGGHVSVNNGDEIAMKLIGKDLDSVYTMAAKALKEDEADLRKKYEHLNPGMQRMNLGNRMRAAAK
jgi:hypothetical protein